MQTVPRVLVLGGTRFLGRATVATALDVGHQVTLFNRGRSNPGLFAGVETILGDRNGDLSALAGRDWDVVVDVAAYTPDVVRRTVDALAGRVGRYVFVSTVSVYADFGVPQFEDDPVLEVRAGQPPDEAYGANKAAAERIVGEAFGDRALVVRPGLIVGPHDPTDRFAYWPRRLAAGGRVLAPGGPGHLTQFIDVRDLAGWIVTAYAGGVGGVFNATGEPVPFGEVVACSLAVSGAEADVVWVPSDRLLAAGVDPWMGVPLWIAGPGTEAANEADTSRARAAGLVTRPLTETLAATLAWDTARGGPPPGEEGLTAAEERRLLELAD